MKVSHSPTRESRTSVVNRLERQKGTAAAHFLEGQEQELLAG